MKKYRQLSFLPVLAPAGRPDPEAEALRANHAAGCLPGLHLAAGLGPRRLFGPSCQGFFASLVSALCRLRGQAVPPRVRRAAGGVVWDSGEPSCVAVCGAPPPVPS